MQVDRTAAGAGEVIPSLQRVTDQGLWLRASHHSGRGVVPFVPA